MAETDFRTPETLIRLYWDEVWNNGRVELIREICGDPIIRHEVGGCVTTLSHDDQIARVRRQSDLLEPVFAHEILVGDASHVASVWTMTSRKDPSIEVCGIEVFHAVQGRLVACWNAPYAKGGWGRSGDPSVPAHLPAPEIVATPAQVTGEWLQRVFRAASLDIPRIAATHDVGRIGHGTTTETIRAGVAYNTEAGAAPHSIIVKLPHADPNIAGRVVRSGLYEREVAACRFLPADGPFRIPRVYFAASAPDGGFTIAMEDLSEAGQPGDQIVGCTVPEAEAVIRECTALHLHYWNCRDLDGQQWPLDRRAAGAIHRDAYARGVAALRTDPDLGTADTLDVVEALAPLIEPWYALPVIWNTLVHGDLRADNVIFEATPQGRRACLLDFQLMSLGDPAYDLAYFLSGSLAIADRRQCERRLVAEHGEAIAAADRGYDVPGAWDRYRAHSVTGLIATVIAAGGIAKTEHNRRLLAVLLQRNCTAIRDLDGLGMARAFIRAAGTEK